MNTTTTTTHGRHREATIRPTWLLPALGVLAAVVLLVVLGACSGVEPTLEERAADRVEAGLPAEPPAVEEEPELSDGAIFSMAMQITSDAMSPAEVETACYGFEVFGMDAALEIIRGGYGDGWDQGLAEEWANKFIAERC